MIEAKVKPLRRQVSSSKSAMIVVILVSLIALGLYGYNAFQAFQSSSPQTDIASITQVELEQDYGLRIQLVAVTAAGGLVDLRLQIVDAEKAKAFLKDPANYPAVRMGNGVVLRTSPDAATQNIQFENGRSIFILLPNTGNILKPGDPVSIVFGGLQVESVQSK